MSKSPPRPKTGTAKKASASKGEAEKRSPASGTEARDGNASQLIDQRIQELQDWRGETLARVRGLIREVDPGIVEEWKWRGVPVWARNGIICTGETYQRIVKLTFAQGAALPDPTGLFNASLAGNTRRAIDIREGEKINARALQKLIQAAIDHNAARKARPKRAASSKQASRKPAKLLSGGNPQIALGEGDGPVQAYIAALDGWKHAIAKRVDAVVVQTIPHVRKAVKWNSPFYGGDGGGWFLSLHVFTRYVKVTFFNGARLRPVPGGGTEKSKDARWIDIHENEAVDEAQLAAWVRQAAALPGWMS